MLKMLEHALRSRKEWRGETAKVIMNELCICH